MDAVPAIKLAFQRFVATIRPLRWPDTSMRWIWTDEKNRTNKRDHGLSFETAALVFNDPLALSRPDQHPDGNRWQTIGTVATLVLFVVHTVPDDDPATAAETGRIISARKATARERRAYEDDGF